MAGIETPSSRRDSNNSLQSEATDEGSHENIPIDTRDSLYSAVILLYFLITVGIVISIVPLLSVAVADDETSFPQTDLTFVTSTFNSSGIESSDLEYRYVIIKVIRNLFSSYVACMFLWFVRKKKSFIQERSVWWPIKAPEGSGNNTEELDEHRGENGSTINLQQHQHNSLTGAVLFLGTCSGIRLFLSFITELQCVVYKLRHENYTTVSLLLSTLNNLIYLFLAVTQMLFFYTYDGAIFSNQSRRFFHFAMASGIASNTWNWLGVTFTSPLWNYAEEEVHINYTSWCSGDEIQSMWILNKIGGYLSILFPEYAIMAMSLLYCYWTAIVYSGSRHQHVMDTSLQHVCRDPNCDNSSDEHDEDLHFLTENATQQSGTSTATQNLLHTLKKHPYVLFISTILCVFYLSMVISSHFESWSDDHELVITIQLIISSSIFVPATFLVIMCLRRLSENSPQYLPLSGNDYLLIFASSWGVLCDLLQIVSIIEMLRCGIYIQIAIVGIGVSCIFSAQTCLQTKLLLTIHRKHVSTIEDQDFIRASLIFLTSANIANWLVTGLVHEWAVDRNYVSILTMGFDHVDFNSPKGSTIGSTIILIIYPMLSLYRFHSAVICYEMLKQQQPFVSRRTPRFRRAVSPNVERLRRVVSPNVDF